MTIAIVSAPRARTSSTLERTLSEHRALGRDADDRGRLVEQCDRAVLHLAGGVGVGRDVGDLLQLQRPLEADRQADVAAEIEEELLRRGGRRRPRRRAPRSRPGSPRSARAACLSSATSSLSRSGGERLTQLGEAQADQVHGGDLGDEGLGRGDADLEPGTGVEDGVGVAGRLAAHQVGDRQHLRAALAARAASPPGCRPSRRTG